MSVASNAITTSSVKTPYEPICSILEGLCQNIIHPFRETRAEDKAQLIQKLLRFLSCFHF